MRPGAGIAGALLATLSVAAATLAANAQTGRSDYGGAPSDKAFGSTYVAKPSGSFAIVNATVLTAAGTQFAPGMLVVENGRIKSVGPMLDVPAGMRTVDATGKFLTPGVVDPHSHVGVGSGLSESLSQANEMTDPNTAEVWAEHSIWPADPQFDEVAAGGVTTQMILPGSANLFGGRTVVVKSVRALGVSDMKFPAAQQGLKMACGENPARVYGGKGRAPATRMGAMAGYRNGWMQAADYAGRWDAYQTRLDRGEKGDVPKRDLKLETLARALRGEIRVHMHCYRAEDMLQMIALSHEFGFKIAAFHHAVEAYKIAPVLAQEGICAAVFVHTPPGKMELYDGTPANAALLQHQGVCVAMHSDAASFARHLNVEAAAAMREGNRAGLAISRDEALRWLTLNPARMLGLDDRIGSLEAGKNADLLLWNADPLSSYANVERMWVDGVPTFDTNDRSVRPPSDFQLGQGAAAQRVAR